MVGNWKSYWISFQSLSIVFVSAVSTKLASLFGLQFSLQTYKELTDVLLFLSSLEAVQVNEHPISFQNCCTGLQKFDSPEIPLSTSKGSGGFMCYILGILATRKDIPNYVLLYCISKSFVVLCLVDNSLLLAWEHSDIYDSWWFTCILENSKNTLFGLLLERTICKQLNLFTSYGVLLIPQFYHMENYKRKARDFFYC